MAEFAKNIFRKQGRPSGDGKGKIHTSPKDLEKGFPWAVLRIYLYNYNIDGNLPKNEHKKWLETQLKPFLNETRYHAELQGLTSASGDPSYNRQLATERVLLVKEFLIDKCRLMESQVPGSKMTAAGESLADQQNQENEFDRAVKITIKPNRLTRPFPKPKPKPPPDPIPPDWIPPIIVPKPYDPDPKDPDNRWSHFMIRYAGGGGVQVGKGTGTALHVFEIKNAWTGESRLFALQHLSAGVGVGLPVTLPGDEWTDLSTKESLDLDDFHGQRVSYYGQAAGPWGWAELKFRDLHEGDVARSSDPATAPIKTGTTLGVEQSIVPLGRLQEIPKGESPW